MESYFHGMMANLLFIYQIHTITISNQNNNNIVNKKKEYFLEFESSSKLK